LPQQLKGAHSSMDRIADSGSADGGSNPSGHTKKPRINSGAFLCQFNIRILISLLKGQEVLAFARMTMHFFNNVGDPEFLQDRNP
jgi:hypothetical protein